MHAVKCTKCGETSPVLKMTVEYQRTEKDGKVDYEATKTMLSFHCPKCGPRTQEHKEKGP